MVELLLPLVRPLGLWNALVSVPWGKRMVVLKVAGRMIHMWVRTDVHSSTTKLEKGQLNTCTNQFRICVRG